MDQTPEWHLEELTENTAQQNSVKDQGKTGTALSGLQGSRLYTQVRIHLSGIGPEGTIDVELAVAVHIFPAVFLAQVLKIRIRHISEALVGLLGLQTVAKRLGRVFFKGQQRKDRTFF